MTLVHERPTVCPTIWLYNFLKAYGSPAMTYPLEELVRLVAYMFYEEECTMVLVALLEIGDRTPLDELSNKIKLRKNDLTKVLGRLSMDGLIIVEHLEDLSNVPDPDQLSVSERKKLLKDYYSLDFKSFVDSVHLKILLIRQELSQKCGREDNVFYECPKCKEEDGGKRQQRKKYIFPLRDLVACDNEGALICPDCSTIVEELDDTEEVNTKKRLHRKFIEITDPLLDLIRQTDGLVMIDDPDERCKPDRMMPLQEYNEEVEKIRQENDRQRVIRKDSGSSSSRMLPGQTSKMNIVVLTEDKDDQLEARPLDPALKALLQKEPVQPVAKSLDQPTIMIGGVRYTADQIDQAVLDSIVDDKEYGDVLEFRLQNL
jgi:transcription initiation factor IIE alpha subunit